jgi:hypothetical protein
MSSLENVMRRSPSVIYLSFAASPLFCSWYDDPVWADVLRVDVVSNVLAVWVEPPDLQEENETREADFISLGLPGLVSSLVSVRQDIEVITLSI